MESCINIIRYDYYSHMNNIVISIFYQMKLDICHDITVRLEQAEIESDFGLTFLID